MSEAQVEEVLRRALAQLEDENAVTLRDRVHVAERLARALAQEDLLR